MNPKNKPRGAKFRGQVPSSVLKKHILYSMTLDESLDEDMFAEKMLIVRYRIISIFVDSVDPRTKKGINGNYLMGVGPKFHQLVKFIHGQFGGHAVIDDSDLHPRYRDLTDQWRNMVKSIITSDLIERQLTLMLEEADLWWLDSIGGIWEIPQSVADERVVYRIRVAALYDGVLKPKAHQTADQSINTVGYLT